MESGAKGCEVIVSGKLRAQRAKAMKFKDGYMIAAGHPAEDYIDGCVRHVMLRQGVVGIKVGCGGSICAVWGANVDCDQSGCVCLKMPLAFAAPQYAQAGRAGHPGGLQQCYAGPSVGCMRTSSAFSWYRGLAQGGLLCKTMHLGHWLGLQPVCRSNAPVREEWGVLGIYSNAVRALMCMYQGGIKSASCWCKGFHLGLRMWCCKRLL